MDFFEKARNIVESTAEVVAKKSGELIETSKIRYSVFDLNSEVKKLMSALGEIVYAGYKAGEHETDRVAELCEQIDAKYREIDALKEQLSEIKNTVSCPSCGKSCSCDTNYCPSCGGELAVPVDGEVDVEVEVFEDEEA